MIKLKEFIFEGFVKPVKLVMVDNRNLSNVKRRIGLISKNVVPNEKSWRITWYDDSENPVGHVDTNWDDIEYLVSHQQLSVNLVKDFERVLPNFKITDIKL